MKSKNFKNGNAYLVVAFIVMGILFFSSAQTYEQQSVTPLLGRLLKNQPFHDFLSKFSFEYAGTTISVATSGYEKFIEFFIRKGAHFFTYFVLGGSWFLGLYPRIKNVGLTLVISWLAATGYAGLDEFHQMLTGGRSPLFQDVFLDSMGALTACVICLAVIYLKRLGKK